MPKFFLHLREGDKLILDEEGSELPDLPSACAAAIDSARDIVGELARSGRLAIDGYAIEIADDQGMRVATVPFAAAFK